MIRSSAAVDRVAAACGRGFGQAALRNRRGAARYSVGDDARVRGPSAHLCALSLLVYSAQHRTDFLRTCQRERDEDQPGSAHELACVAGLRHSTLHHCRAATAAAHSHLPPLERAAGREHCKLRPFASMSPLSPFAELRLGIRWRSGAMRASMHQAAGQMPSLRMQTATLRQRWLRQMETAARCLLAVLFRLFLIFPRATPV